MRAPHKDTHVFTHDLKYFLKPRIAYFNGTQLTQPHERWAPSK